ncbi:MULTISPECIES: SRPBCC domain-containing protein [unclassified Bosea (in: a-proteobacteria)]|uniref:SRPBCC family protein n=1 Tax=unclassified Bosea (in: a-proteobacteria) TaxID=2653178 RepID=UPI000F75D16D|nr:MULTISPECIES: SRPBCC domain-containing protein [unclassified Bosea (in: a-proteobacteria)]AZO77549.1 ATPase [Bosea sp. Tri-49]RXT18156.1 ATPase [Bosea sp. Tri-39]RXT32752.1 ATPase [Bosea sp. Tri-54]
MTAIDLQPATQEIVVDEILPHAPETIWKALTSSKLIARWIMEPFGFAPVEGTRFTFKTTPAGAWDGTIHCQVLDVIPNERLAYSWRGGDDGNAGYGSRLDTVVTWTLSKAASGTRVRLVHSGFELPRNEAAFTNMGRGWKTILPRLGDVAGEDN